MASKIIVFLVEGITDKTALGLILSKLFETDKVHVELTTGDISYKDGICSRNAKKTVWNYIKEFLEKNHRYKKNDIKEIIHLIDTDGAFVPDDKIVSSDSGETSYTHEQIIAKNKMAMLKRNKMKKEIIKCLCTESTIGGVPYSIYYLSRNMEHVFHNKFNELSSDEKMKLAENFQDKFADNPDKFLSFINDENFIVLGDYNQTWNYIFEDINSLKRKSNLNLIFQPDDTTTL